VRSLQALEKLPQLAITAKHMTNMSDGQFGTVVWLYTYQKKKRKSEFCFQAG